MKKDIYRACSGSWPAMTLLSSTASFTGLQAVEVQRLAEPTSLRQLHSAPVDGSVTPPDLRASPSSSHLSEELHTPSISLLLL